MLRSRAVRGISKHGLHTASVAHASRRTPSARSMIGPIEASMGSPCHRAGVPSLTLRVRPLGGREEQQPRLVRERVSQAPRSYRSSLQRTGRECLEMHSSESLALKIRGGSQSGGGEATAPERSAPQALRPVPDRADRHRRQALPEMRLTASSVVHSAFAMYRKLVMAAR